MALGRYRTPREFKNEDKWFRYFTSVQAILIGASVLVGAILIIKSVSLGLFLPASVLALLLIIVTATVSMAIVPKEWHLYGGGRPLWLILSRCIYKKISKKKKIIYVNYLQERK